MFLVHMMTDAHIYRQRKTDMFISIQGKCPDCGNMKTVSYKTIELQYVLAYYVFNVINSLKCCCFWSLTEISEQKFGWWLVPSRCIRDDNIPVHCGNLPPTTCFTGKMWCHSPGISCACFEVLKGMLRWISITGNLTKRKFHPSIKSLLGLMNEARKLARQLFDNRFPQARF